MIWDGIEKVLPSITTMSAATSVVKESLERTGSDKGIGRQRDREVVRQKTLKRYPYAKFVSKMPIEKIEPLEVSIKSDPQPNTEPIYPYANADEREVFVDVIVHPSNFEIAKGGQFNTIRVPVKPEDSDPVIFFLRAKEKGVQKINVKFFQQGSFLGELVITTIVELDEVGSSTDLHVTADWPIPKPLPASDIVIYIIEKSKLVYDVVLSSIKIPYGKFGPLTFPFDPEEQMRSICSDIKNIKKLAEIQKIY